MNKIQYRNLLKSPLWAEKRKEILERDNYTCRKCKKDKKVVHVHHKYYRAGRLPWDYPKTCFLTLCAKCHKAEHKGKKISEFIKK